MLLRVEDLSGTRGLKMTNAIKYSESINGSIIIGKCILWTPHPVAVYGNAAYCWSKADCSMIRGGLEDGKFHWKMCETNVPLAMRERDELMRFSEGVTSTFTVIVHSRYIGNPYNLPTMICQLDLATMQWKEFPITDPKVTAILNKNSWQSCYIWTINRKVHIILNDQGEAHLILDSDTDVWEISRCEIADSACAICGMSKHFMHYDKLYKFELNEHYKYDLHRDKSPELICMCTAEVVLRATRVYLFCKTTEDFLAAVFAIELCKSYTLKKNQLCVEFFFRNLNISQLAAPTLFDFTLSTILRDEKLKKIAEEVIPSSHFIEMPVVMRSFRKRYPFWKKGRERSVAIDAKVGRRCPNLSPTPFSSQLTRRGSVTFLRSPSLPLPAIGPTRGQLPIQEGFVNLQSILDSTYEVGFLPTTSSIACHEMLLRVEDLSAISGLTISNAFILDNEIVCVSKSLGHDWQMYSLNSETFALRRLIVDFHDLRIPSRIHRAVAVHENAAYTWDDELKRMIVGTIEGDTFHWKSLETDVPIAMRADDIKIVYSEGASSTFTSIVANGHVGPNLVICQLNLVSLKWTHFCIPHQEDFKIIRYIWSLNGKVHMICNNKMKEQLHLVINVENKEINLFAQPQYSPCKRCLISKHFIHDNKLYKFRQSATGNCLLLRFDDACYVWQKMFELSKFPKNVCPCNAEVIVIGSRVFILTANSRFKLRKLFVVEMAPTLKDHALAVVLRHATLKTVGEDVLPDFLTNNLYRDISGDSLVKERRGETRGERQRFCWGSRGVVRVVALHRGYSRVSEERGAEEGVSAHTPCALVVREEGRESMVRERGQGVKGQKGISHTAPQIA
ncbi:hypothetical protein PRIPAC_83626, partial [Pristionchus pacificus]|uniref:Uncharacterized protein n=1 Tax=Pristionchus pacificus TaxID=54126 RepID=A0A2A6CC79_PRIPA